MKTVLILDDEPAASNELRVAFERCKEFTFEIETASNAKQAEGLLAKKKFDVVTIDLSLGGKVEAGLELIGRKMVFASCPDAVKIVVTGHANIERCVQAMRLGTWDFIDKEGDYAARAVQSAVSRLQGLEEENRLERFIFDVWLPRNEESLLRDYSGNYVAINVKGDVIAHGQSMIELGFGLARKTPEGEAKPFILQVQRREAR